MAFSLMVARIPNSAVIQPFRYGRFARSIAETSGGTVDEGLRVRMSGSAS